MNPGEEFKRVEESPDLGLTDEQIDGRYEAIYDEGLWIGEGHPNDPEHRRLRRTFPEHLGPNGDSVEEEYDPKQAEADIEDEASLFRVRNRLVKMGLARHETNDDDAKIFEWTGEGEQARSKVPDTLSGRDISSISIHDVLTYSESVEQLALEDKSYRERYDAMMRVAREKRDAMMRAAKRDSGRIINFAELAKHPKDGYDDPAEEAEVQRLNDESRSDEEDYAQTYHDTWCDPETCRHIPVNSELWTLFRVECSLVEAGLAYHSTDKSQTFRWTAEGERVRATIPDTTADREPASYPLHEYLAYLEAVEEASNSRSTAID